MLFSACGMKITSNVVAIEDDCSLLKLPTTTAANDTISLVSKNYGHILGAREVENSFPPSDESGKPPETIGFPL